MKEEREKHADVMINDQPALLLIISADSQFLNIQELFSDVSRSCPINRSLSRV